MEPGILWYATIITVIIIIVHECYSVRHDIMTVHVTKAHIHLLIHVRVLCSSFVLFSPLYPCRWLKDMLLVKS